VVDSHVGYVKQGLLQIMNPVQELLSGCHTFQHTSK
jgi:hypothetical protein